jgi:hypothetical protein
MSELTNAFYYDVDVARADFPILHQEHHVGVPLIDPDIPGIVLPVNCSASMLL